MKKYGVLIVDDSAFMRRAISHMIEKDPLFHVVGIARNGIEAIEKAQRLKPALITMDVEMPVMNGLKALEEIMKVSPVPVVMLSSRTSEGAKETIEALELGAIDFFLKDNLIRDSQGENRSEEFLQRLNVILESAIPIKKTEIFRKESSTRKKIQRSIEMIIIGSSTGGPSALQTILPMFAKDFPIPILVAQHMPMGFTKPLAERFSSMCNLCVKEAENNERVEAGTIYIAPSGYQTWFEKQTDSSIIFKVDKLENLHALYKPSIDLTLNSAAPIYAERLLAIILTGMGVDGTEGSGLVKQYKGTVLVEDEASSIVYGMPKSVLEAGYADDQIELAKMYNEIISYCKIF